MLKILIILALAAVGGWYVFNQAKQSKVVTETQKTAVEYTTNLQKDVKKAQNAADSASKALKKAAGDVKEALPQ